MCATGDIKSDCDEPGSAVCLPCGGVAAGSSAGAPGHLVCCCDGDPASLSGRPRECAGRGDCGGCGAGSPVSSMLSGCTRSSPAVRIAVLSAEVLGGQGFGRRGPSQGDRCDGAIACACVCAVVRAHHPPPPPPPHLSLASSMPRSTLSSSTPRIVITTNSCSSTRSFHFGTTISVSYAAKPTSHRRSVGARSATSRRGIPKSTLCVPVP